ncbi:UV-endonuclease UvdE-domain-containing protein [Podospora conica]|nr:UV-endonuclease UvdE-domain-containing protein [Schizothecium conicum]
MPRKPKKPPSSSPSPPEASSPSHPNDMAQPPRPEVQLRRSGRRVAQPNDHEEEKTREIQAMVLGHKPNDEGILYKYSDESDERAAQTKEGVQLAIDGLVTMERRLKMATQTQKQKVAKSMLANNLKPPDPDDPDAESDSLRASTLRKAEPSKKEQLPSKKTEPKAAKGRHVAIKPELTPIDEAGDTGPGEAGEPDTADLAERGAARPPPVNSSRLPLPWKGRLGYACLNTYLRSGKVPVFSSRTCRMASIIDHRYPLQDPSQPEHATKNRPDKGQGAQHELGEQFVQNLGLANARDIVKMLMWNDKYGIKFLRLSSEMFPFASHLEHGYKLAPFASEVLAEAGKVAARLGHRLTTHPGQFTQLGSPRKEVVESAIRDLEYHNEMLSLLRLPDQQNRDAVMIIHMGGTFGDKAATLDRFRKNYARLSNGIKARLVLENDDVSWTVHDLLPICEELNIPLVLDYHHHNILFDSAHCREGTYDISQPEISERITATWRRKNIKQKMHYSEPCAGAVTPKDRRKHSPRVSTLPPCPNDVDLMIEAKDKEQAVFELMRTFKLPGFDKIHDMIPHQRVDENQPPPKVLKKKTTSNGKGLKRRRTAKDGAVEVDEVACDDNIEETTATGIQIPDEEVGMGGPENRVYWPPGNEEWLRPKKREMKRSQAVEESE